MVLASLVMLQHAGVLLPARVAALLLPLEVGSVAVYCFFVVSGFVIAEAIDAFYVDRPGAFLLNRLLRLMPCYIAALLLSAVVLAYAYPSFVPAVDEAPITPERFAGPTVALNVLALFPVWRTVQAHWQVPEILEQGWALRIEFLFYLTAAASLLAAALVRTSAASVLTLAGVGGLLALALMGHRAEGSFFENTPYFVFGVAFYYVLTRRSERWLPGVFCLSACAFAVAHLLGRAATFGTAQVLRDRPGELLLLTALTLIFMVLARIPEGRERGARWSVRLDRLLGELTYPLYLMHGCLLIAAKTWLPHERWASVALAFAGSYLLSFMTVLVVERPVARLRTTIRRRRAPIDDVNAVATTASP